MRYILDWICYSIAATVVYSWIARKVKRWRWRRANKEVSKKNAEEFFYSALQFMKLQNEKLELLIKKLEEILQFHFDNKDFWKKN